LFGQGYREFSTGEPEKHYLEYANSYLDQTITLKELRNLHDAMFTTTNTDLITWIQQFPTHQVVIVTNTNPWQTAVEKRRLPQLAMREYRSHEQQLMKREFFADMLSELPETQCVFIDDLEKNVQKARELGIRAHQYTDMDSLKTFFSTLPSK
jgi:FMN phosphatase YigB (HAD superfamily)